MKVLIAVSSAGTLKHYMEEPFLNWLKKEVLPIDGVEVIVYGDRALDGLPFHPVDIGGNKWADDVIWATHEAALETARNYNFDAVVFQGLDCITTRPGDYKRFLEAYTGSDRYDIVAPIQMGRKTPDYPVVRNWVEKDIPIVDGSGVKNLIYISSKQEDVTADSLNEKIVYKIERIPVGFPGTEMCLINKQCFNIPIQHPDYIMWYTSEEERYYLCVHEFWMLNAARQGFQAWVDTTIQTAHCDDSGLAAITLSAPVRNEEVFKVYR